MEQGENEVGWMNEVSSDSESFIEIEINEATTRYSHSTLSSPSDKMDAATIFSSSASSCFSGYTSVTKLMMKLRCLSIVGVMREKLNVGEKWVLKVIHGRRHKSSLQYYCEGSTEETLTEAAIAYCNASSFSKF